jgi:uncharacterized membrane protein (UPF0127 family)
MINRNWKFLMVIIATLFILAVIIKIQNIPRKNYVEINGYKFYIELADTAEKQTQGLSNHQPIKDNEGMLFMFADSLNRNFWMKNMLFPLDIIWINGDKIVNISHNIPPEGESPVNIYSSEKPANYVLEVNAGSSKRLGIKINEKHLNLQKNFDHNRFIIC